MFSPIWNKSLVKEGACLACGVAHRVPAQLHLYETACEALVHIRPLLRLLPNHRLGKSARCALDALLDLLQSRSTPIHSKWYFWPASIPGFFASLQAHWTLPPHWKRRWRVYEKYMWEKLLDTKIANLHSSSSPDWLHKRRATRTTTQTSITIPRPSTTIIKGIFHFFFTFRLDNCWCQFSFLILWNVQIPPRAQPTTQYNNPHFLFRSLSLFIGTASMKDIFKMTFLLTIQFC